MFIATVWPEVWAVVSMIVPTASAFVALVPAPASGPLAVLHKVMQVLALAVGNAKIASPDAPPSVGEVVKDVVEAVTPVANTTAQ
jgi:hypothetical protein